MDTYKLHMAVAALAGASLVAVSTYYIHQKTVSNFFEFVKIGTISDRARRLSRKRAQRKANGSLRKLLPSDMRTVGVTVEKPVNKAQQRSLPIKVSKSAMFMSDGVPMPEFSPGYT